MNEWWEGGDATCKMMRPISTRIISEHMYDIGDMRKLSEHEGRVPGARGASPRPVEV